VAVAIILCAALLLGCFLAARRSPLVGLCAVLTVGYLFGIIRANLPNLGTYFLFDASALGLYSGLWTRPLTPVQRYKVSGLLPWLACLIGWPLLLFFLPIQGPFVQLLGLRAAVFFLPFLFLGAMLDEQELYNLAIWVAVLDLMALTFALLEFFIGVPYFYPRNSITKIIYDSNLRYLGGTLGSEVLRIPACFATSPHYGMAMVTSIPLLLGAWMQRHKQRWYGWLLISAVIAATVGTFMSASRAQTVIVIGLLVFWMVSSGMQPKFAVGWLAAMAITIFAVSQSPRLQRIFTIDNMGIVSQRVSVSVNDAILHRMQDYPMGNGLGGGGTPIPYFLTVEADPLLVLENEYSRIMLEEGIPGLALWLAFLAWVFLRRPARRSDPWKLGRRLAWFTSAAYFATGWIGLGLIYFIPGTALLFVSMGWLVSPQPVGYRIRVRPEAQPLPSSGFHAPDTILRDPTAIG
jgi:hypothetical protein